MAARLDPGLAPRGASSLTISNNRRRAFDFWVVPGVSRRMVLDVGDWDRRFTINSPGQSGHVNRPHSRDLFQLSARDEAVPRLRRSRPPWWHGRIHA